MGEKQCAKQRGDAGGSYNAMMDQFEASTGIGGSGAKTQRLEKALRSVQAQADRNGIKNGIMMPKKDDNTFNNEKIIKSSTVRIRQVAEKLNFGESITQRCVGFMQTLGDKGELKAKKDVSWICALIHLASRQEGVT